MLIGATGGVGRTLAQQLMTHEYHVIASCRTQRQGRRLIADGRCQHRVQMNLSREESVDQAFAELAARRTDSLAASINCAAITRAAVLETMTEGDFHDIMLIFAKYPG